MSHPSPWPSHLQWCGSVGSTSIWPVQACVLPPQARSQAEDFVFEWDEDEEEGEDNQTLNLFEERMAAQAAAAAASGQDLLLGGMRLCAHC